VFLDVDKDENENASEKNAFGKPSIYTSEEENKKQLNIFDQI